MIVPKRYPKHCPKCGSSSVDRNPRFGMRCRKCKWDTRQGEFPLTIVTAKELWKDDKKIGEGQNQMF
jgi:ribosomal protein L37AE/L43A